jgi:hypothetical protein
MRYDTVGCTQILWDFFCIYIKLNEIWVIYNNNKIKNIKKLGVWLFNGTFTNLTIYKEFSV